jgi:hypothetical protein
MKEHQAALPHALPRCYCPRSSSGNFATLGSNAPGLSSWVSRSPPLRGHGALFQFSGRPALMCSSHSQYSPAAPTMAAARAIQPFDVAVMK